MSKVQEVVGEVYKAINDKAIHNGDLLSLDVISEFAQAAVSLAHAQILPPRHLYNAIYGEAISYGIRFEETEYWIDQIVTITQRI